MDQSVVNFAVYEDSIEYEGMAQVTLPDVTMRPRPFPALESAATLRLLSWVIWTP